MNRSTSSTWLIVFTIVLTCIGLTGCGPNFGEKIVIEGTEIYFKDGAEKSDADKLAKTLKTNGFVDGKKKSVQLLKRGSVWEFRMAVASASQKDKKVQESVKPLLLEISSVLDGGKVEVHLCNSKLESISVVKGLRGKRYTFDQTDIFYSDVSLDQTKSVAAILFASGFPSEPGVDLHISQPETTVEIRMATNSTSTDTEQFNVFTTSVVQAASKKVFNGSTVEFAICDPFFNPTSTTSSK